MEHVPHLFLCEAEFLGGGAEFLGGSGFQNWVSFRKNGALFLKKLLAYLLSRIQSFRDTWQCFRMLGTAVDVGVL